MRVLCMNGKYAIEIECAKLYGTRLIFTTSNNIQYQTDDYYNESIAYDKLYDLTMFGYLVVEKLYRR